MRLQRVILTALVLGGVAICGYFILRGWAGPALEVKEVPPGAQEIAWLAPATGSDAWERLVAAAKLVQAQWQGSEGRDGVLKVDFDKAFLELTADVPEIAFSFSGTSSAHLLIRWYKLSGDFDARIWLGKLAARNPPPLAVIGGDISDRAIAQARALNDFRGKWRGADPVYLVTTAT